MDYPRDQPYQGQQQFPGPGKAPVPISRPMATPGAMHDKSYDKVGVVLAARETETGWCLSLLIVRIAAMTCPSLVEWKSLAGSGSFVLLFSDIGHEPVLFCITKFNCTICLAAILFNGTRVQRRDRGRQICFCASLRLAENSGHFVHRPATTACFQAPVLLLRFPH